MAGMIDCTWIAATPEILPYRPGRNLRQVWGDGFTGEYLVRQMDAYGFEAVIMAAACGERPQRWAVPHDVLQALIDRHPGRIFGLAGFNVFEGERSLRAMIRAIDQLGFNGLHVHPHWLNLPPSAPQFDPFYRMAVELGVPIVMMSGAAFRPHEVGHNTMAAEWVAAMQRLDLATVKPHLTRWDHPIYLDDVCRRFPDVKIVALTMGWPWTDDLVDICAEHPNLYVSPSRFYPSTWNQSLVDFLRGPGAHKILWGTDYPEIDLDRALQELRELALSPEVYDRLVRQNAIEVFRLA